MGGRGSGRLDMQTWSESTTSGGTGTSSGSQPERHPQPPPCFPSLHLKVHLYIFVNPYSTCPSGRSGVFPFCPRPTSGCSGVDLSK